MADLKQAFMAIKKAYTKTDTLVLDLKDEDGAVIGSTTLVLDCSPNRRVSEFLELRDKGLCSARKFQEIIFTESVVKIGDIDLSKVKEVPIDDDPEMQKAFKGATAVTVKEFLQYQAETAMGDFILDNVEAIYSHMLNLIAKEKEGDVHNKYIDDLRKKLAAANAAGRTLSTEDVKNIPVPGQDGIPMPERQGPSAIEELAARTRAQASEKPADVPEASEIPPSEKPDTATTF